MSPCLRWYALYTKPRCERVVSERLRSKGFETYLPAITVNGGRGSTTRRPFFPCYLFVRLDLSSDALSSVRWTPGLKHIVSFDDRPAVVPDEVIALIRERLAILGQGDKETRGQGENAAISLSQIEAMFEPTLKPAERTWVLIRFLNQVNRVQVAVEGLEPVGVARVAG